MPERGRRKGSGETALQESSDAATVMPAKNAINKSVKTAATASVTESEIAALAYQLWLDSGCPIGSADQEHWFRAEAMLRNALAAKCEDLSRRPSIPSRDTRTESEMLAEFASEVWQGHWEVWEREWVGACWVSDVRDSGVRVSNRAG